MPRCDESRMQPSDDDDDDGRGKAKSKRALVREESDNEENAEDEDDEEVEDDDEVNPDEEESTDDEGGAHAEPEPQEEPEPPKAIVRRQPPPTKAAAAKKRAILEEPVEDSPEEQTIETETLHSDNEEPHRSVGFKRPKVASEHFDAIAEAEIARKKNVTAHAASQNVDGVVDTAIIDNVTFVLLSVAPAMTAAVVPKEDLVHAIAVDDNGNELVPFEVAYSKDDNGLRATATTKCDIARKMLQKHGSRMLRSVILTKIHTNKETTSGKPVTFMQAFVPVRLTNDDVEKDKECKNTIEQLEKNLPNGYQLVLAIEEKIVKEMYKITKHGLPTKYTPSETVKFVTVKNVNDQIKIDPNWKLCAKGGSASRSSGSSSKRKNQTDATEGEASNSAVEVTPKKTKAAVGARQRASQPTLTEVGLTKSVAQGDSEPVQESKNDSVKLNIETFAKLGNASNLRGVLLELSEAATVSLIQTDPEHVFLTFST